MPSNVSSGTQFVPSSDDGSYTRPDTIQSRIAQKMKLMPRVDANGRDLPPATADPTVIAIVDPAALTPTGVKPNPLQGAGGGTVPAPAAGGSTLDRITAELTRKLAPPIPEGYTPAPPR